MKESLITPGNIMFVIFLLGTIFGVYNYFKKPQDEGSLIQKEVEGKALLLAQQVQTEKEYNTKKFIELTERFNNTDGKIEELIKSINDMNLNLTKQLTKVQTIVEEHLKIK